MRAYISEIFLSIQGEGILTGVSQLFIRFGGCDINCSYCDTKYGWEKSKFCKIKNINNKVIKKIPNPISTLELVNILQLYFNKQTIHSLAITGGEPLLQVEFLQDFCKNISINTKIYLETAGIHHQQIKKIYKYLHFISIDIKLPSIVAKNYFKQHKKFIKSYQKKIMQIKIVIDKESKKEEFLQAVKLIKNNISNCPLIIQPNLKNKKYLKLNLKQCLDFQQIALNYLNNVRVIPQIHKLLSLP